MREPDVPPEYGRGDWVAVTDAARRFVTALTYQGGELGRLLVRPPDATGELTRAVLARVDQVDAAANVVREVVAQVARDAYERSQRPCATTTDTDSASADGGEAP